MRRNIHVMYKNFRGIVLTKTLLGFEGRLNPAQLKKELKDKNVECSLVPDWVDMFAKDWFVLGGE